MIEARITCTCANVTIADLGLRLTKGAVIYVDEKSARKSKDLMLVARAGGVAVHFIQRVHEIREPTAVVGRPRKTPIKVFTPIPRPPITTTTGSPTTLVTPKEALPFEQPAETLTVAETNEGSIDDVVGTLWATPDTEPVKGRRGRSKKGQ